MNEVWGRCAEEVSLDLTGSFWTNLLPRVKNEATIKVFASQASEESDWETTAYGLSKRLVSRSKFWRDSKAVMQRIANPSSPVRLRVAPPENAGIAQLVERNLAKVEVDGSRPFSRSK